MPPLKMGKTIADKLKGPQGTPTSLDPKASQNLSLGSSQKQQTSFENSEKGE
jgi:hypothetical protein